MYPWMVSPGAIRPRPLVTPLPGLASLGPVITALSIGVAKKGAGESKIK